MIDKKLLIVEDNFAEAKFAQKEAQKAGIKEIMVAENLEQAQKYIKEAGMLASDLFFPAGNIPTEAYLQRFLPFYDKYKTTRFTKISQESPVKRAIENCARVFGVTPQEYVENIMTQMNNPPTLMKMAREALAGIKDPEKYNQFLRIEQNIREGKNLPLGVIITEQAKEKGLPAVIVTSTYHHSDEFEPIRELVRVTYFDTMVDGRKNWQSGINYLVTGGKK